MFKFTVIPFSAVPCRQFRPPGRDIPLTVIDYTLSMCGFPDKKTRFVLIIRDMVLVTPDMASMISDWSTMEKASSSCSKRSIRSSVSAFSARSRLPVLTIVLERFPFFASADYVFATVFCAGFVCATLKYPTVPAPATQTAATGMITISLLRRRFIFLNLKICCVCSLCFKNTLKEKCIKTLCDLWKPGEKGILFFIYKYK